MKKKFIWLMVAALSLSGCAQSVSTFAIKGIDSPSTTAYTMYQYSSGAGERLRAVLLKNPESDVEIIPYSVQITTTKGTLDDGYRFMERGNIYRQTSMLGVSYKGKTIGYLITSQKHMFSRDAIDVSLFERDGKVYFSVYEQTYGD